MRRSVNCTLLCAGLLLPAAPATSHAAALQLQAAAFSHVNVNRLNRPLTHVTLGGDDRADDTRLFMVTGELLFGGLLLMAGSAYALRRTRR